MIINPHSLLPFLISFQGHSPSAPSSMPAAAERPRPPQILPIREGPRKQSPPPYNKSPNTKSPPPSSLSSTQKPVLSPRTKKSLPSPPLEPGVGQFDKSAAKPPRSPSPLRPEPEREPKLESKIEPQLKPGERAEESTKPQDGEEKTVSGTPLP